MLIFIVIFVSLNHYRAIRHLLVISILGFFLQSCVDVLPVPSPSDDKKLLVICEMSVSHDIKAEVSYTGTLSGVKPGKLEVPDTFNFSIVEGEKDFGVAFRYNARDSFFQIPKSNLSLRVGETYKFRGAGSNPNTSEPSLVIPDRPNVDSITISELTSTVTGGKTITEMVCSVKYRGLTPDVGYFHLIPLTEKKETWEVIAFEKDHQAYKRMNHKKGLLIDGARVKDQTIKLRLRIATDVAPEYLYLDLGNATEAYYKYNYFLSNTYTDPNQTSENQAIAAFNINTPKAYGTFSAVNFVSFPKKLKD